MKFAFDFKSFGAGFVICIILLILFVNIFNFGNAGEGYIGAGNGCVEADAVFSPNADDEIIEMIRGAEDSIDIEMYVFTNEEIARELVDAADRGVRVRVILESRVNAYNLEEISNALRDGGVQLRWASFDFKLTHSKMMIVDEKRVLVGSINFSKSAVGKNREVGVVMEGEIVEEYASVFEEDREKATY
ncbi:MAG: phospholipase D-like domain-containing protein [Candidatus Micrarchaeota archaeon]